MPKPHACIARLCGLVLLAGCAAEAPPPPPAPVIALAPVPVSRAARAVHLTDALSHCRALAAAAVPGVHIAGSEFIADGIAFPFNSRTHRIEGSALPEHCRITGSIDSGTASLAFEMRLPSRWNGRFFDQGRNDGVAGVSEAVGRNSGAAGLEQNALTRGFAVFSSSAAARGPAVQAAKALIAAYYGRGPDRSYFVGCAAGASDGLAFAQRWPQTFDGIVAVAPLLRETNAAMANAWTLQHFAAVAPHSRKRQPMLAQAFSRDELFGVAQAVLQACDKLDGAEDGFVMDMAACKFDPAAVQCKRGKPEDCLRAAKVKALREAMAGPRDGAGKPLYVAWPWDPGIAAPAWRSWNLGMTGSAGAPARGLEAATAVLGAAAPTGVKLNALSFDFKRDPARLAAPHDSADADVRLDAFRQVGGRLLLVHGAADPVVSAWATVDYQRTLDSAYGADVAAGFARTFIVPGMNHCAGGPATDRFDALAALVDWVEQDRPPERIEAGGSAVLRDQTRPLCPWPKVARYRAGALDASASYACR